MWGLNLRPLGDEGVDVIARRFRIGPDRFRAQVDDDQSQGGQGGIVAAASGLAVLHPEVMNEGSETGWVVTAAGVRDFEFISGSQRRLANPRTRRDRPCIFDNRFRIPDEPARFALRAEPPGEETTVFPENHLDLFQYVIRFN
ncbi:MAG: hypothetical protein OXU81_03780 [Gammaproteobacteria bacterium]|nr:hypothetical protein [Gammaproteobacteria bacterium]